MNLIEILNNIGLNEKEAQIYLACLELGEASASKIASKAKVNRVSTYDILERMVQRSLMSEYSKEGVKVFSPLDPKDLIKNTEDNFKKLKQAIPEFERIKGNSPHPRIQYYEGLKAIKNVYADTLTAKTEILNYADSAGIRRLWPEYDQEYVDERVKQRIYLRGIAPKDESGTKVLADNESHHREIRLVKSGPYGFANEINIYDNKVSIISFHEDELVGMIIENEEIANTQRAIFMMAWEFAGMQNNR